MKICKFMLITLLFYSCGGLPPIKNGIYTYPNGDSVKVQSSYAYDMRAKFFRDGIEFDGTFMMNDKLPKFTKDRRVSITLPNNINIFGIYIGNSKLKNALIRLSSTFSLRIKGEVLIPTPSKPNTKIILPKDLGNKAIFSHSLEQFPNFKNNNTATGFYGLLNKTTNKPYRGLIVDEDGTVTYASSFSKDGLPSGKVSIHYKNGEQLLGGMTEGIRNFIFREGSKGNYEYGAYDPITNLKNDWWVKYTTYFDTYFNSLKLYSQGKKIKEYNFTKRYPCLLSNLPRPSYNNKESFYYYSPNKDCSELIFSRVTYKKLHNKFGYHDGNIIITDLKIEKNKIISGNVSSIFNTNINQEYLGGGYFWQSPSFSNIFSGSYIKGVLNAEVVGREWDGETLIFKGQLINGYYEGAALCGAKGKNNKPIVEKCLWKYGSRIDKKYTNKIREQNKRIAESNCWHALNTLKKISNDLSRDNFNTKQEKDIPKNLKYNWDRDTTKSSLSCDTCYVETLDGTKIASKISNKLDDRINKISKQLASTVKNVYKYKCANQNEISHAIKIVNSYLENRRKYADRLNDIIVKYMEASENLAKEKKKNIRKFNKNINAQYMNIATNGLQNITNTINKVSLQNSKLISTTFNKVQIRHKKDISSPPASTKSSDVSFKQQAKKTLQDSSRLTKASCLKERLNTWENGVCITNIPWDGGNCYDPKSDTCYKKSKNSKLSKEKALEAQREKWKKTLASHDEASRKERDRRFQAQSQYDKNAKLKPVSWNKSKTDLKASEATAQAFAACWQNKSNGWICHGPLQRLYVSEGSLKVALERVSCKTHNLYKKLPGKAKLLGKTVHVYNCNKLLKEKDIDVFKDGYF